MFYSLLAGLILVLFSQAPAWACGQLTLKVDPVNMLWKSKDQKSQEVLTVHRDDTTEDCQYFVTFSTEQRRTPFHYRLKNGSHHLQYRLLPADRPLQRRMLGDFSNQNHVLSGEFVTGRDEDQQNFVVQLLGSRKEIPFHGAYSDRVTVKIFKGRPSNRLLGNPDHQVTLPIEALVQKFIDLSVVGRNLPFDTLDKTEVVDFGELKQGKKKEFDLVVRSNSPYTLDFSSYNNGELRHIEHPRAVVPYIFFLDAKHLDLRSEVQREIYLTERSFRHRDQFRHRVKVVIGRVGFQLAGRYRDSITVTAKSKE